MTIGDFLRLPFTRLQFRSQYRYFSHLLDVLDFKPLANQMPASVKSITFVVNNMTTFSGGHTVILRLGTALAGLGYDVRYITFTAQPVASMKEAAHRNLPGYKGECLGVESLFNLQSDIWVATHWESAYHARNLTGYKAYLVQDYEPYFYVYGEKSVLCRRTYEFGFRIITLGPWVASEISKNIPHAKGISWIDFPYERTEYKPARRDFAAYPAKNRFTIAVYVKNVGRRAPFIIQNLLGKVIEDFNKRGVKLDVLYFGESRAYRFKHGRNLGKLSGKQLTDLYEACDFGMVASLTNISLVPYEMMATGLPVIEFADGSLPAFLQSGSAIVTSFDWRELANKLTRACADPTALEGMTNLAQRQLARLSWESSAAQFANLLTPPPQ